MAKRLSANCLPPVLYVFFDGDGVPLADTDLSKLAHVCDSGERILTYTLATHGKLTKIARIVDESPVR